MACCCLCTEATYLLARPRGGEKSCMVLSAEVASILENEVEKKLAVILDEVVEIHRDSYLCRICDTKL